MFSSTCLQGSNYTHPCISCMSQRHQLRYVDCNGRCPSMHTCKCCASAYTMLCACACLDGAACDAHSLWDWQAEQRPGQPSSSRQRWTSLAGAPGTPSTSPSLPVVSARAWTPCVPAVPRPSGWSSTMAGRCACSATPPVQVLHMHASRHA